MEALILTEIFMSEFKIQERKVLNSRKSIRKIIFYFSIIVIKSNCRISSNNCSNCRSNQNSKPKTIYTCRTKIQFYIIGGGGYNILQRVFGIPFWYYAMKLSFLAKSFIIMRVSYVCTSARLSICPSFSPYQLQFCQHFREFL